MTPVSRSISTIQSRGQRGGQPSPKPSPNARVVNVLAPRGKFATYGHQTPKNWMKHPCMAGPRRSLARNVSMHVNHLTGWGKRCLLRLDGLSTFRSSYEGLRSSSGLADSLLSCSILLIPLLHDVVRLRSRRTKNPRWSSSQSVCLPSCRDSRRRLGSRRPSPYPRLSDQFDPSRMSHRRCRSQDRVTALQSDRSHYKAIPTRDF